MTGSSKFAEATDYSGISGCGKYELSAATLFYMPVSKPPVMASSTQCIDSLLPAE